MTATLPIKASALRFSLAFDVYNKTLTFTDLLQYYAIYGGTMKGMLSLVDPDGLVFYQNPGYAIHDFSAPDIEDSTPTWSKVLSGVNFPKDSAGKVKLGYYTFYYMVTTATTPFVIAKVTWKMDYASPVPKVSMVPDNLASTLLVSDITNYTVIHNTVQITPTLSRLITVKSPINPITGSPVAADVTTDQDSVVIGPDIFSEMYTTLLLTTLTANLELWGTVPCLIVTDTIAGDAYKKVVLDNCMCQYYSCITAVQAQMDKSEGSDPAQYNKLRLVKTRLNDYILLYQWALSCGKDAAHWCKKIKEELLNTVPCECAEDDGVPVEIIPLIRTGGGSSTTPSTFKWDWSSVTYIGTTVGNNGDVHSHTDGSTYLYMQSKVAGVWTAQSGNLYVTSVAPPTPATIIVNDTLTVGTDNGNSEKDLDTYTFTPSDYMDTDGDVLHVFTMFQEALNDDGKKMNLYFGGDIIVSKQTDSLINSLNNIVTLEMWITRMSSSTQNIVAKMERYGEVINTYSTNTKDLTASQIIKMTGQNNGTVYAANDVMGKVMRIELIKMIPALP